jgi:hypothetical protein
VKSKAPAWMLVGVILTSSFGLLGVTSLAYAQSNVIVNATGCGTIGGTWLASNSTCILNSDYKMNVGDRLSVPQSPMTTLVVANNSTLTDWGVINSSGTIVVQGAFSTGGNGFLYNLGGTVVNNGSLYISGDIGTIINSDGGTISNSGLLSNLGNLINRAGSTITNQADGNLDSLEVFVNNGVVVNYGVVSNKYHMTNQGANGTVAKFENYGSVYNSATFNGGNQSILENLRGGNLTNAGSLINSASLVNSGNLNNTGAISNYDSMVNNGTITNLSQIANYQSVVNSGTINNTGIFNDYCGSVYAGNPVKGSPVTDACIVQTTTTSVASTVSTPTTSLSTTFTTSFSSASTTAFQSTSMSNATGTNRTQPVTASSGTAQGYHIEYAVVLFAGALVLAVALILWPRRRR